MEYIAPKIARTTEFPEKSSKKAAATAAPILNGVEKKVILIIEHEHSQCAKNAMKTEEICLFKSSSSRRRERKACSLPLQW